MGSNALLLRFMKDLQAARVQGKKKKRKKKKKKKDFQTGRKAMHCFLRFTKTNALILTSV